MDLSSIHPALGDSYVAFFVLLVFWLGILRLVVRVSKHYAHKLSKKTKSQADDIILGELANPLSWLLLFVGVYVLLPTLPLGTENMDLARRAAESLILFMVVYSAAKFLNVAVHVWGTQFVKGTKSRADDALLRMFRRSITGIGCLLALLMILELWGIEVGPLIASLGIAGVAVAFALQSTLGNVFGGLSMLLDNTFATGDWVEIGGVTGVVEDVGIRSTKIRTWDNEIITVPNGKAADDVIRNFTQPTDMIRVNIPFGVAYGNDIERVKKIVLNAVKKAAPDMLDDPAPYVLFTEFGDSSLNFVARFYLPDIHEKLFTQETAAIAIYKALNKAKVEIPFPQMDVYVKEFRKRR